MAIAWRTYTARLAPFYAAALNPLIPTAVQYGGQLPQNLFIFAAPLLWSPGNRAFIPVQTFDGRWRPDPEPPP